MIKRHFWIIDLVFFQLAWLICALANHHAVLSLLVILAFHFYLSPSKKNDFKILLLAPIGILLDQTFITLSILNTTSALIPIWLILLWCIFVMTINHSLAWLSKLKCYFISLLGMIFGPLSYFAATKFDVISLHSHLTYALIWFALAWSILLPSFVAFRHHFIEDKTISKH